MKINGIAGGRHPSKKKGDVIELSPEQKIEIMAKEQVVENSPEGIKYIPISAEAIGKAKVMAGRVTKNKTEPAQYSGKVKVKYRALRLSDDRLKPTKEIKVKIHCKDCRDDMGVDDLEAVDFKIVKEY